MSRWSGGPSLCPPDAPKLEQAFALTMGAWLAFGPSCARYRKVGRPRATSEKELILCNLLARRDALLELGGFNEKLYPNEENALMDELQKRGGKLLYDPELIVYRRAAPHLPGLSPDAVELRPGPGGTIPPPSHLPFRARILFRRSFACSWRCCPFCRRFCRWVLAAYGAAVLAQALAVAPLKKAALVRRRSRA